MIDLNNIYERLEFIKANIIADERRDALQQVKELMDIIFDAQQKQKMQHRLQK